VRQAVLDVGGGGQLHTYTLTRCIFIASFHCIALSTVNWPLSTVHCPLSTVNCQHNRLRIESVVCHCHLDCAKENKNNVEYARPRPGAP
jgi:hypothetical protein